MDKWFGFLGFGYVARTLAPLLRAKGYKIWGTHRQQTSDFLLDLCCSLGDAGEWIPKTQGILSSIPPTDQGDPAFELHHQTLSQTSNLAWLGYLSATNVYGDHGGQWVTESSTCAPTGATGQNRYEAEQAFYSLWTEHQVPIHIFRLAGIYGPGRSLTHRLKEGKVFHRLKDTQKCFSRIHVEDIAQILLTSIEAPTPGEIYNLADDEPAELRTLIEYACEVHNLPLPPLVSLEETTVSAGMQAFLKDSKLVSNEKMKKILGVHLKYPTYREGLL